jgi:hypothetical protein
VKDRHFLIRSKLELFGFLLEQLDECVPPLRLPIEEPELSSEPMGGKLGRSHVITR